MTEQPEIILLTGFLGAGKTTLLNRLLKSPYLSDTGFIINEFGAVGIDNQLVETADESMVELMNGCLCCTIKGDLPDTVTTLLDKSRLSGAPLRRIVIETTGLADPAPIMQALMGTPFLQNTVHLSTVLTVVDAVDGMSNLRHFAEARRQATFADRIILSKTNLAGKEAAESLLKSVKDLNNTAEILIPPLSEDNAETEIDFCRACLAAPSIAADNHTRASAATAEPEEHNHHHDEHEHHHHDINRHGETIRSFTLTANEPLPLFAAEQFAYLLSQNYGRKILRFKGIIHTDRAGTAYIFQGVQGQFYPPQLFTRKAVKNHANAENNAPGSTVEKMASNMPDNEISETFSASTPADRRFPPASSSNLEKTDKNDSALSSPVLNINMNSVSANSSQIVIIADGVPELEIRRLFDACRNAPAPDTADRAALTDNPLAIPGMKF